MDNMVDLMSAIKLNTCPGGLSTFQRTCIVGIGFIIQISCFLFRNWGIRIKGQRTVRQGEKAVLEGIVKFNKSIKYLKWQKYHNGEYFDINIHSSKYKGTTTSLHNPVLQIHEFDVDDDVLYRLAVVMFDWTKYSDHQRIRIIHKPIKEKPGIEIYTDQKNTRYFVGEDVTIKANIDRSSSIQSATWQRKTENGSQTLCTALPKYIGSKDRRDEHLLMIKNCNESDRGLYFLLAACTYTTEDIKSNELHLDIVNVPEKPKILLDMSDESESIEYGNTITIKAEIKACPAPSSIYWEKRDKDGQIEEIIERSGKFVIDKSYTNCQKLCIKNLDLSDNGDYEIIVTNAVGEARATIKIEIGADKIIFISGPTVVAPSANIELRVDYQSNQGVKNSKWLKIKNFITNQLTFENPKYSIGNSAKTGLIKTQKVVISDADIEEDSAAYHLFLGNMKSNKLNIFVDDCGKYSTEQEGNCLRFFALQTVSANAMRIAFDKMQPTKFGDKIKDFEQYCKSNARNPKLKELLSNINANKPTSSKDLDISLMYVIIRNSTRNPTKPKNGWGKSPSESDISTADDIERIRLGRNRICHENALNMKTSEFNKSVLDLIWAIRRLSMDDVKLMGDVCDVMNKVFTKGEIMEGMIEQLNAFQKDAQNFEQLYQNEAPVPQEESQLIYQRSSNEDIKFHSFHDSDILLKENGTLAIKPCMTGDGICLTNRPLKIGEKVHIRIVTSFYHYSTDDSNFHYINIGTTSIPPERIFGAKNVKKAVMGRLNYIKTPCQCQCYNEVVHNHWFGHPLHICISLCRNGSLLVCCEDTEKYYPSYTDDPINTPLWLVINICYCGSVWISHA